MLPEVIGFSETDDAVCGHSDILRPYRIRLVVVGVYGRPKTILGHFENLRYEFPRPGERFLLEIISEREVAEHLEICAVARGLSDVVDIESADALLTGRHTVSRRLFLTGEELFQRGHSGIYEKQRFVVFGNERKAAQTQVSFGFEKREIHLPQVIQRSPLHLSKSP